MLMLDEKVLAEFLKADLERNRKLDALIAALEQQKPQWLSSKAAMEFSGLDAQKIFYLASRGKIRKRSIADRSYEYNFEDLRAVCGK